MKKTQSATKAKISVAHGATGKKSTVKASVAKTTKRVQVRDRQREEDIRLSFHNGMLAGLEEVKRNVSDKNVSSTISKIANRVIAHRDTRVHKTSRWYTGSCRAAVQRSAKKNSAR